MDFLTTKTQFQCASSPAVTFTVSASGKVEYKNSKVLTTSAKLTGNGICTILTAMAQSVPQPCQFQQTAWINCDMTRKANGENLLTDKSFCNCFSTPTPSVIKVCTPLLFGFQSGNFSAQIAQAVAALPQLDNETKSIKADNQSTNSQVTSHKLPADNKQENEVAAAKNTADDNVTKNSGKSPYILKCLTCPKKDCEYHRDKLNDFSDKVKRNSTKSHSDHEKFNKIPGLVEFVNACGYKIKCSENCIVLSPKLEGTTNYDNFFIQELETIKIPDDKKLCPEQIITSLNEFSAKVCTKLTGYKLKCFNCPEKNCKYRFVYTIDKILQQPSKQLTDNYIDYFDKTKNFNAADIIYRDSVKLKGAWSYQAHHIIPKDDSFTKVPELVNVAIACGYDINCAENCIMLPSRQPGHGTLDPEGKDNSTFEVMAQTGMQVHLGPHDRTQYAELLIKDLKKIDIPLEDEICPIPIIKALNRISAKVRNKLVKFNENPMASYPYYVSDFARKYAMESSRFAKFGAFVRGHAKRIVGRVTGRTKISKNAEKIRDRVLKK